MYLIKSAIIIFANVLNVLIFIRVIISWLPIPRNSQILHFLYAVTEPILAPIRNLIEKSPLGGPGMMIDFSPMLALIFISMLSNFIVGLL